MILTVLDWLARGSYTKRPCVLLFQPKNANIFFIIIFRVESDDDDSETFVNGSESQDHSETASFYLGDKHIPVYASEMKELSNSDIARLLLDPPEDKVASKPPVKCQENKIFIIDKKIAVFSKLRRLESRWPWSLQKRWNSCCCVLRGQESGNPLDIQNKTRRLQTLHSSSQENVLDARTTS